MIKIYEKENFDKIPKADDFDTSLLEKDQPSAHLVFISQNEIQTRCSVWWDDTPRYLDAVSYGTIGHFYVSNSITNPIIKSSASIAGLSDDDAGLDLTSPVQSLLSAACDLLKAKGCGAVLAPMCGNTWRSYRYQVPEKTPRPPFLMEPEAGNGRDTYLLSGGFTVCQNYISYQTALKHCPLSTPPQKDGSSNSHRNQNREPNTEKIEIKQLDHWQFEQALDIIYHISIQSFSENPYYTPLSKNDFFMQYTPFKNLIVPEMVLFAYIKGIDNPIGFLFCIPDYLDREINPASKLPKTLLAKTIGVLPEHQGKGVSSALYQKAVENARKLGFTSIINALIYTENRSNHLCKDGNIIRQYQLFEKTF